MFTPFFFFLIQCSAHRPIFSQIRAPSQQIKSWVANLHPTNGDAEGGSTSSSGATPTSSGGITSSSGASTALGAVLVRVVAVLVRVVAVLVRVVAVLVE